MTASKIQSRPNSFLTSSAATPRNSAFASYSNPEQLRRNVSGTKRCLFGKPDSAETKRLYDESVRDGQQRFLNRYNFDISTGKPAANSSSSISSASSSSRSSPTREYYSSSRPNETSNASRRGPFGEDSRKPYSRHH